MVSALVTQAPHGSSRREVFESVSADTALDIAYVLMTREVAEASSVPYRQARVEVDKMLQDSVPKSQEQLEHERLVQNIRGMSKYRKGAVT